MQTFPVLRSFPLLLINSLFMAHLLGASYPTNLLLNALMCLQSARQLQKCPGKEKLQACPDPNNTRVPGGNVLFVRLTNQCLATRQFLFAHSKEKALSGRVAFLHGEVQLHRTTMRLHTCARSFPRRRGGWGDLCVCVCVHACVLYYPDLFTALRQMPDRCAQPPQTHTHTQKHQASQAHAFSGQFILSVG